MHAVPSERAFHYFHSAAFDCWGVRRGVTRARRGGGLWYLSLQGFDEPPNSDLEAVQDEGERKTQLARLEASGAFTAIELATLRALALQHLTFDEIAGRDGCSRQAVVARVVNNSKHQGGMLKKARRLLGEHPTYPGATQ